MGTYTTIFPQSAKGEYPQGIHNFCGPVTPTGTLTSGTQSITGVSSLVGVAPGATITAPANLPAGSFVAAITGATSLVFGGAGNATGSGSQTLTITGNVFKIALGIASPAGSYGLATANYSQFTADELAAGNGYTTGGNVLTVNQTPAVGSGQAYWQWSINPSWTSATFSTGGCIIYNTSSTNKVVYVGNLGTQSVTGGTITLLQPSTNGPGQSLLQLN